MILIVGLGNPGKKYEQTRHNLGFMVVEHFLKDFEPTGETAWQNDTKLKSDVALINWQPKKGKEERLVLAKPKTFMNNSGMAVQLISAFYKIKPEDIWVVYDELDLPVGAMKIRFGGAAAGHHGAESIMNTLGTDKFWRFRLGIGESHNKDEMAKHMIDKSDEYVLGTFNTHQAGKIRELTKRAADALETAIEEGMEAAMNQFNTK